MNTVTEVGIDHLTMLDVSPPELVTVAREAGFDSVSPRVASSTPSEVPWPMTTGSPMLEETVRRLDDTGIRVLAVEVVRIGPGTKREEYEPVLEVGAQLGARYVTVNSDDPNLERAGETFAVLTAVARSYGLRPLIEPIIPRYRTSTRPSISPNTPMVAVCCWIHSTSNATAASLNSYVRWTLICCPTCSCATRHSCHPAGYHAPLDCLAANPRTGPICSWRAGPCACCRETANCRWPSFSACFQKERPSAWRLPSCRCGRPLRRSSSQGALARRWRTWCRQRGCIPTPGKEKASHCALPSALETRQDPARPL